jgi:hypothetical protein
MMKISSRGVCCPGQLPVEFDFSSVARRESQTSLLVRIKFCVIKFI